MIHFAAKCNFVRCRAIRVHSAQRRIALSALAIAAAAFSPFSRAQQTAPVVVQPGAPGQPSKTLPPDTKAKLPPQSPADVAFMQGMIMHHAQAVEMTALIDSHTSNKDL